MINGLVILSDRPVPWNAEHTNPPGGLEKYFKDNVIAGPGSFTGVRVALSVATPGPFMLFTTFAGFLAGGLRGAAIATFFVFLPSFVFVLVGARYVEQVRNNREIQAFLAGISAAVVGLIVVVSLDLIPEALTGLSPRV